MSSYRQGSSTKSLNAGVTGVAPSSPPAASYNVYISTDATNYHRQNALPILVGTPHTFNAYNAAGAAPPTSNTAMIRPPASTSVDTTSTAGTFPAGTFYVTSTYVTAIGETTITTPPVAVITDGAHALITTVAAPVTAFITLELAVPRLEDWHVTRYAIQVSSNTSEPFCDIYVDSVALNNILDTTNLGSRNSANADLYFRPGQILIAQWSLLDLSAIATFSVFGEKTS